MTKASSKQDAAGKKPAKPGAATTKRPAAKRAREDEREKDLAALEQRIGYAFQDRKILRNALIHKSYVNERKLSRTSANERLEFLGDAVLELVVSHAIMDHFPQYTEGQLSKLRASIVNEQTLADVSKDLGLGQFLFLGKGEARSGGGEKASILSDAYEAVIAAVYLDGGIAAAETMIKIHLRDAITKKLHRRQSVSDFKTDLQEYCQGVLKVTPEYRVVEAKGPDHQKEFTIALSIDGSRVSRGTGRTKKQAEQRAAALALKKLGNGKTTVRKYGKSAARKK